MAKLQANRNCFEYLKNVCMCTFCFNDVIVVLLWPCRIAILI